MFHYAIAVIKIVSRLAIDPPLLLFFLFSKGPHSLTPPSWPRRWAKAFNLVTNPFVYFPGVSAHPCTFHQSVDTARTELPRTFTRHSNLARRPKTKQTHSIDATQASGSQTNEHNKLRNNSTLSSISDRGLRSGHCCKQKWYGHYLDTVPFYIDATTLPWPWHSYAMIRF